MVRAGRQGAREEDEDFERSFLAMRKAIGSLGFWLPVLLILIGLVRRDFKPSISEFYYSDGRDLFIAVLFAIGFFFLAYTGHRKEDDERVSDFTLAKLAGVAVLGVAFLPTTAGDPSAYPTPLVHEVLGARLAAGLHYLCAGVFFVSLAVFCHAKFRRGDATDPDKQRRNRVYTACGWVIYAMVALLGALGAVNALAPGRLDADRFALVFWLEAVAVWAFAVAWLVKGRAAERLVARVTRGLAPR